MPVDATTAFDLSLSIDVHAASFARTGERAIDGVQARIIGPGEFVTWRARHFGVTWTMTNAITAWDRPARFVDEQRSGPFKSFRHEHVFSKRMSTAPASSTASSSKPRSDRSVGWPNACSSPATSAA